jgi:hypothetical protein
MTMKPALRKLTLTIHLIASVGWIGAIIPYLALVVTALAKPDAQTLRIAWTAMALVGWDVLIPLAFGALLTGIILSLGTSWGLFRHYWVLFSLALTLFAAIVLLQHMQTVSYFAGIVSEMPNATISGLPGELFHSVGGLLVLLVVQGLNVYKPQGMTSYGWRKLQKRRTALQP